MSKHLLLLPAVAVAVFGCAGSPADQPKAKALAGPLVSASELLGAYRDDAGKADAKYKDQWLRVKGKVKRVSSGGTPAPGSFRVMVFLKADETEPPGEVEFLIPGRIIGEKVPGTETEDFQNLKANQEVTIGGVCQGAKDSRVSFTRAVLLD